MQDVEAFAENIFIIDGPLVQDMGIWFPTRMAVVKLDSGSLWVNSPVQVPPNTLEQIKAMGEVKYLVAATPRHIWRLEPWNALFPDAQLWVTPQIRSKVKFLMVIGRKPLPYRLLENRPPRRTWEDEIDQLIFEGSPLLKEVFFYHRRSRTVILDDIIQNHPFQKDRPVSNALIKFMGVTYPHGGVGHDIQMSFMNRKVARRSLQKLLAWDFDKLIIAHGACVRKDAKYFVKSAFRWLGA